MTAARFQKSRYDNDRCGRYKHRANSPVDVNRIFHRLRSTFQRSPCSGARLLLAYLLRFLRTYADCYLSHSAGALRHGESYLLGYRCVFRARSGYPQANLTIFRLRIKLEWSARGSCCNMRVVRYGTFIDLYARESNAVSAHCGAPDCRDRNDRLAHKTLHLDRISVPLPNHVNRRLPSALADHCCRPDLCGSTGAL